MIPMSLPCLFLLVALSLQTMVLICFIILPLVCLVIFFLIARHDVLGKGTGVNRPSVTWCWGVRGGKCSIVLWFSPRHLVSTYLWTLNLTSAAQFVFSPHWSGSDRYLNSLNELEVKCLALFHLDGYCQLELLISLPRGLLGSDNTQ